jgi:hypothetical protein
VVNQYLEVTDAAWQPGPPGHNVEHIIETTGPPVTAKFRRLDPSRLAAAKAELKKTLNASIIRHSNSPWSSLLHLVKKKDGSWLTTVNCDDMQMSGQRNVVHEKINIFC